MLGRNLEQQFVKAEFFVEKDRTVSITFYDAGGKVVAPSGRTATVIAEAKSGKQTLKLEKTGDALVSAMKLPEGDGYNIVVQLKQTPEAKPQIFRFTYDASICGGCKRAEYACTCHS